MTDLFLDWLSHHGVLLICVTTFLSCLAAPVPASLMMLTAGGFVASGDMVGWSVIAFAFAGAVLGDQAGFALGRTGGNLILSRLSKRPKRAHLIRRATDYLDRRAMFAVFFSRWLVSPLGPYVNLAGGASPMTWLRFSSASIAGEAVWVLLYVNIGYIFADRIDQVAGLLGNASGALAAGTVTILMGFWLRHSVRAANNARSARTTAKN